MKRNKKLLLMLAVLVVLIGATVLATSLNPDNQPVEEETVPATIFALNPEEVTAFGWQYNEAMSFTRSEKGWHYTDNAAFPANSQTLEAMLQAISQISANKALSQPGDPAQYGLDDPICTVTVTTDTPHTLVFGQETSLGGEWYFSTGDGNVYIVDGTILDPFRCTLYDLLQYEDFPSLSFISELSVKTVDNSYTITYQDPTESEDRGSWLVNGAPADTQLTETFLDSIADLNWLKCVEYNAADLAAYGFMEDSPIAEFACLAYRQMPTGQTDENGEPVYENARVTDVYTLQIGSTTEEGTYARLIDSNMVYLIDTALWETIRTANPDDLKP